MNSCSSTFSSALAMVLTFSESSPCLLTNKNPIPTTMILPNSAYKAARSKYISSKEILAGLTKFFAFFTQNSFILSEIEEKFSDPLTVSISMNNVFLKFFMVSIFVSRGTSSLIYMDIVSRGTQMISNPNRLLRCPKTASFTSISLTPTPNSWLKEVTPFSEIPQGTMCEK